MDAGQAPVPSTPGDRPLAHRQLLVWENGAPIVRDIPLITPSQINDLGAAALTQLYSHPDDELAIEMGLPPSRFHGMTLIEVMLIRQAENAARSGATDEVEAILDRRLGKPKTTAENHNVNETYEQALSRISKSIPAAAIDAELVSEHTEAWDLL